MGRQESSSWAQFQPYRFRPVARWEVGQRRGSEEFPRAVVDTQGDARHSFEVGAPHLGMIDREEKLRPWRGDLKGQSHQSVKIVLHP